MSQAPLAVIIPNSNERLICEEESTQFRCTVAGNNVRWIAEPFANESGDSEILFFRNSSNNGRILSRANEKIQVQQTSASPFLITIMTVSGSLRTDPLNITCLSVDTGGYDSELLIASGKFKD